MTIRLSADQCTATIPPTKAVRVEFKPANKNRCQRCDSLVLGICTKTPCSEITRLDGRNGYWAKAKKGKRVTV